MRDTMRTTGWLGALKSFFLLLFWPPGIAARRERIPWTLALGAHALGIAMAFLAVGLAAWIGNYPGRSLGDFLMEVANDVYAGFQQKSLPELLAIAGLTVVMLVSWEINALLAGLVVSPFGARDEKLRSSYWRGVKAVWLISPHVALTCGGLAVVGPALSHIEERTFDLPQPQAVCLGIGVATLAVWLPTVLLFTVSAGRWGARCRWPGVCRDCGYPLVGLAEGATDCSECGLDIDESLSPPGPLGGPLEDTQAGRWPIRWLVAVVAMIFIPRGFGRRLRLLAPQRRHMGMIVRTIILLVLIPVTGAVVATLNRGWINPEEVLITGALGAYLSTFVTGAMLAVAWLVGSVASLMHRRNLLAASAQAASYLMPLSVLWVLVAIFGYWCLSNIFKLLQETCRLLLDIRLPPVDDVVFIIGVCIPVILLAGLILQSLIRVTWAARHNNE